MSALRIASGLKGEGKVLLLDTERGSAKLYADKVDFDTADLPDHKVETYVEAIRAAANMDYEVLIVDSASHLWQEVLDMSAKMQGNSFTNWNKLGSLYNQFVEAVLNYPKHIIVTTRAKMKYEQVEEGGKKKVLPMGLDPIMRDGFEYEVDVYGLIDVDHNMTIRKTRIEFLADQIITKPGEELGEKIRDWLLSAEDAPEPKVYRYDILLLEDDKRKPAQDYCESQRYGRDENGYYVTRLEDPKLKNCLVKEEENGNK